ncbi:hypothetical protein RB195_004307 [Necator americanus]|uniref:Peptidase M12A domain-containing protein n=1 Tax=Necator americanus TaxID=51031 RepID=A0ABR1BLH0_NECAM
MRTLVLLFLLALCVNAGFFDTKFGKHLKKLANKIKDSFNTTAMLRIREKIDRMTEKIKKKLTLRPEQKAILGELLKRLNPLKTNNSLDFSIQRVNERSGVGQLLYQGDIALREEQFDSFVTDEFADDDDDDEGREKRQAAFRNQYYPLNIWSEGIDYYFHSSSTRSVRSVFKKAAEAWQKDTCIDFRENSRAEHRVRVTVQTGCWSMIGRDGGEQDLSLGKDCDNVGCFCKNL